MNELQTDSILVPGPASTPPLKPDHEQEYFHLDTSWLWDVFVRYWFYGFIVFVLAFIGSICIFIKDPPLYTATAKLKIDQKKPVFSQEAYVNFDIVTEQFYRTQIKLLQSRSLIREAIETIGMDDFDRIMDIEYQNTSRWEENSAEPLLSSPLAATDAIHSISSADMSQRIDVYIKNLTIMPDRLAPQIVTVSFRSPSALFSTMLANKHSELYIEYSQKSNEVYTDEYIAGLNSQLIKLDEQIKSKDQEILSFKKENGFFQIQGVSSYDPIQDIDDRLTRVREQLAKANNQYAEAKVAYESVFFPGETDNFDAIQEDIIQSESLTDLKQKRTQLTQEWAEIKDKYLENHPSIINLSNQLQALNEEIDEEIFKHVERLRSDFEESEELKTFLTKQEQDLIQEKYNRDDQWTALKSLEQSREQMEAQKISILRDLQNAKGSLQTQQKTRTRIFEIVDPAEIPMKPINRNWLRILFLSLAAAFSAGLTTILLLEYQDQRIRTPDQAEQLTGLSVIGCIPVFQSDETNIVDGRIREDSPSPAGEAFIALRTRFLFSGMIRESKSILITSSIEKEGKSTVVVNLASALALIGKKVVIIDCDYRRPSLHRFFGEPSEPGLCELIEGVETIDNVLFETDVPGLHLIPAGALQSRPSDVFTSSDFEELMQYLRQEYDYILLDSSPVLATPDPSILSTKTDNTLLVVRSGTVIRDDLLSAIDHIHKSGGAVFSLIVNSVPISERSSYMRDGYGYSAYSDYGSNAEIVS